MNLFTAKLKNLLPFFSSSRRCPVCNEKFKQFYPLPSNYKKAWRRFNFPFSENDFETLNASNFSCPSCGSTDRDRIFALYLVENIFNKTQFKSILDIAPSAPLKHFIIKSFLGKYVTADLEMDNVDFNIDIQCMDVFANETFDLVICSHVLEHVPNDTKAMKEILRILRPGGIAMVMVPIVLPLNEVLEDPNESIVSNRWKRFGQDDHVRLYSKKGFIDRLLNSGFKVEELPVSELTDSCHMFGIHEQSVLYLASK